MEKKNKSIHTYIHTKKILSTSCLHIKKHSFTSVCTYMYIQILTTNSYHRCNILKYNKTRNWNEKSLSYIFFLTPKKYTFVLVYSDRRCCCCCILIVCGTHNKRKFQQNTAHSYTQILNFYIIFKKKKKCKKNKKKSERKHEKNYEMIIKRHIH